MDPQNASAVLFGFALVSLVALTAAIDISRRAAQDFIKSTIALIWGFGRKISPVDKGCSELDVNLFDFVDTYCIPRRVSDLRSVRSHLGGPIVAALLLLVYSFTLSSEGAPQKGFHLDKPTVFYTSQFLCMYSIVITIVVVIYAELWREFAAAVAPTDHIVGRLVAALKPMSANEKVDPKGSVIRNDVQAWATETIPSAAQSDGTMGG